MKNILLSGIAFAVLAVAPAYALAPQTDDLNKVTTQNTTTTYIQEARRGRGGDDSGGDDNSGDRGGRGGDDNDRDDNSADDNGSDNDESGSGRKKPRIPGGSGCDDPGDVAEHAGCRG